MQEKLDRINSEPMFVVMAVLAMWMLLLNSEDGIHFVIAYLHSVCKKLHCSICLRHMPSLCSHYRPLVIDVTLSRWIFKNRRDVTTRWYIEFRYKKGTVKSDSGTFDYLQKKYNLI